MDGSKATECPEVPSCAPRWDGAGRGGGETPGTAGRVWFRLLSSAMHSAGGVCMHFYLIMDTHTSKDPLLRLRG